ncbi:MAG: hypothetical protein ACQEQC_05165 [Elusimicrobiota bacterium]
MSYFKRTILIIVISVFSLPSTVYSSPQDSNSPDIMGDPQIESELSRVEINYSEGGRKPVQTYYRDRGVNPDTGNRQVDFYMMYEHNDPVIPGTRIGEHKWDNEGFSAEIDPDTGKIQHVDTWSHYNGPARYSREALLNEEGKIALYVARDSQAMAGHPDDFSFIERYKNNFSGQKENLMTDLQPDAFDFDHSFIKENDKNNSGFFDTAYGDSHIYVDKRESPATQGSPWLNVKKSNRNVLESYKYKLKTDIVTAKNSLTWKAKRAGSWFKNRTRSAMSVAKNTWINKREDKLATSSKNNVSDNSHDGPGILDIINYARKQVK